MLDFDKIAEEIIKLNKPVVIKAKHSSMHQPIEATTFPTVINTFFLWEIDPYDFVHYKLITAVDKAP